MTMKMEQGDDLNRQKVGEAGGRTSQGRRKTPRPPSSLNIRRRILLWRRQDPVMAEPQWGWSLSDAVILAAAVMLVVATTVFAQEYNPPIRTLVKNFDQSSDRGLLLNANQDGLELDIEGTRRESTADEVAPEHLVVLRLRLQRGSSHRVRASGPASIQNNCPNSVKPTRLRTKNVHPSKSLKR